MLAQIDRKARRLKSDTLATTGGGPDFGRLAAGCALAAVATVIAWIPSSFSIELAVLVPVLLIVFIAVNTSSMPLRFLSWPNCFMALLFVSNIGYYYLVVAHAIRAPLYLPSVDDPGVPEAIKLCAVSITYMESAVLVVRSLAFRPGDAELTLEQSRVSQKRHFLLVRLGAVVAMLGAVLYAYLIFQLGGFSLLVGHNYQGFENQLNTSAPLFGTLGITYVPAGLLMMYAGSPTSELRDRRRRRTILLGLALYVIVTTSIGDRNHPLLAILGLLYVHQGLVSRIRWRTILAVTAIVLIAIPIVGARRNGSAVHAQNSSGFSSGLLSLTSAYWPYVQLIDLSNGTPRLGFAPYASAIGHVVPSVLASDRGTDSGGFVRTTRYVTEQVSPIDAKLNFGLGGSGIGEPYASFGVPGIAVFFLILGGLLAWGELKAFGQGRVWAQVFVILSFAPVLFYVRDDIFGLLRPIVWGAAFLMLASLVYELTRRGRTAVVIHRNTGPTAGP